MTRYTVTLPIAGEIRIDVEADNPEQAAARAVTRASLGVAGPGRDARGVDFTGAYSVTEREPPPVDWLIRAPGAAMAHAYNRRALARDRNPHAECGRPLGSPAEPASDDMPRCKRCSDLVRNRY